jgi:hypothetical protein
MIRSASFLFGLALVAAPVAASNYSATLTTPTSGRFIARDITWTCGAAACQGATQESRPPVLCQSLAKRAGHVESFLADGRAFTAAELDKCNAAAKDVATQSLAQQ